MIPKRKVKKKYLKQRNLICRFWVPGTDEPSDHFYFHLFDKLSPFILIYLIVTGHTSSCKASSGSGDKIPVPGTGTHRTVPYILSNKIMWKPIQVCIKLHWRIQRPKKLINKKIPTILFQVWLMTDQFFLESFLLLFQLFLPPGSVSSMQIRIQEVFHTTDLRGSGSETLITHWSSSVYIGILIYLHTEMYRNTIVPTSQGNSCWKSSVDQKLAVVEPDYIYTKVGS